jgi:hypothetical protein
MSVIFVSLVGPNLAFVITNRQEWRRGNGFDAVVRFAVPIEVQGPTNYTIREPFAAVRLSEEFHGPGNP